MKILSNLTNLFREIALTKNKQQLQQRVVPQVGMYFSAKRYSLFVTEDLPPKVSGLFKKAISREYNPVLRPVIERHAPIHEGILMSKLEWQSICPRFDHGHVMAGPIVKNGKIIGGLGITRDRGDREFDSRNIADMSAICLHISTHLATIEPAKIKISDSTELITKREAEIAELVAQGLTNAEIGKRLWITENTVKQTLKRIFRKLNVSSRAAMVAFLITDR